MLIGWCGHMSRQSDEQGFEGSILFGDQGDRWEASRRRLRALRSPKARLITVVVGAIGVVLIIAITHFADPFRVTDVIAYQAGPFGRCHQAVTVKGEIFVSGMGGTVRYEWIRPDGTISPVHTIRFAAEQNSQKVRMDWLFPESENGMPVSATLKVLSPNATSQVARMFYACF